MRGGKEKEKEIIFVMSQAADEELFIVFMAHGATMQ
jgi:hypothetical protein